MPSTRRRRRKSRKRKPSSRKKKFSSSRKRSRSSVSRPPANTLSSDEDFVLESGDEDSSSVSDGSVASSTDEDTEEEEHDEGEEDEKEEDVSVNFRNAANQRGSSRPRKRRRRRPKPDSSDEEFNVHLERASNDTESARERYENSRSARTRGRLGNSADDDGFVTDIGRNGFREGTSHPARVQHRCRTQDSSDEDFDVNIDKVLDITGRANEVAVATRPVTRAMDAGQVSDFVHLEGRLAGEDSKSNFKMGEAPFSIGNSSAREANSMDKDTAANKRKGKEKVVEGEELTGSLFAAELAAGNEDGATAVVVCGICLNETAIVDRGKLDCCDHFFCFGCIMEWAKVESRCPMCKQRFTTVAKSGSGISKRTRTVRIPLRDQVYTPPEDDVPYEDPYADIICMECQGTGDEGLLLLCDRCDSAAHTFCVGLGRSVPRGDWYCRDCQALTGENSDNENEAEELVLASEDDEEEDDEFLLRSIVASENPPTRQRRVQRETVSTSRVPSRPRRRLGASERRRLWRRLLSRGRRGSSRRAATAPQLSQSARAFLSSITPELNPVSRLSEASQSGAARTVPQQRRLQERIMALRNNWGRIQHGDIEFDAVRTQAAGLVNSTVSSSGTAPRGSSSTSAAGSAVDNRVDVDSAEPSSQGVKDLEQAWRMMGQAQNLSAGTNSSPGQARNLVAGTVVSALHQQRVPLFQHVSKQSSQSRISQTTPSTILRTGALSCTGENIARSTNAVRSTPLESTDASIKREPKEHQEDGITVSLALARIEEDKKQGHPCSSSTATLLGFCMDSSRTSQLKGGSCAAVCVEKISVDGENTALSQDSKPPMINLGRPSENISLGRTHNLTGDATNKEGASYAKESNEARPPNESLKVHLIELVKKQTWPVYIAERLDKEQFKRIARAAVHALLDHCDPKNKSSSFGCSHFEDQGKSPVINCCRKCLDQHVEDAVRSAKDKIVPR